MRRTVGSTMWPWVFAAVVVGILNVGVRAGKAKSDAQGSRGAHDAHEARGVRAADRSTDAAASAPAIDTRGFTELRQSDHRRDTAGKRMFTSHATGTANTLHGLSKPRTLSPPPRNAIGIAVPRDEAIRRLGIPVFPSVRAPVSGVTGQRAPWGAAEHISPIRRTTQSRVAVGLTLPATPLHRSGIGGPGSVRPGYGLSGLGGPAKLVAGINGTAIRPKH